MTLNTYEIKRIKAAYKASEGKPTNAAGLLAEEGIHVSQETISKYWKRAGLKVKKGGSHCRGSRGLSREEVSYMMKAYARYDGDHILASRSMPYHSKTIRRYWDQGITSGIIKTEKRLEERVE